MFHHRHDGLLYLQSEVYLPICLSSKFGSLRLFDFGRLLERRPGVPSALSAQTHSIFVPESYRPSCRSCWTAKRGLKHGEDQLIRFIASYYSLLGSVSQSSHESLVSTVNLIYFIGPDYLPQFSFTFALVLHHWILGHVFTRWSSYLPNVHDLKAYDLLLINHFAGLRLSNFWLSLAIQ